ncbi:hypothetical protein [Vibrio parahaemolyticus]|uniref:hypothetical protein n=4 Tax=Vibrio parahaemolyticus TaxID=670 RepID=UPI00193F00E7|nr:hypothetical protein [Vibrio parahaemolyticus]HCZ9546561.1 hypothetical protein [Vibrio alginolyticus]EGQ8287246.1 hypothetical protein [Vibrio parahaemolyticus]EGQ8335585.1 hypothetical protein [Vibrio parahaemolyticus]EJG0033842.1 hypothetical protein [Vibrio parahaemolyticus]MBM4900935.1 hypothetical protein [Vibrio parahaemolyticus]
MKYRKTEKWDDLENSKNLLFFAQLFDELFFDFSLDTYKPSSMNTSLLCEEALDVIEEIQKGNIKAPNLQHVIDELCENLSRDKVAHALLSIKLKQINATLRDPKKTAEDKKIVVELILRQINLKRYKKKNEELLIQVIKGEVDFSSIRSLARSYATTLLNLGFSSEYIAETTQKFFHYDKNRIHGNSAIEDFIKIFCDKPKQYQIVFRSAKDVDLYKDSLKAFDIKLVNDLHDLDIDHSKHKFPKSENEVYICVSEIKARDNFSAKNTAEDTLEMLSTMFGLFHHKQQLSWTTDCLIWNETDNEVSRSRIRTNAMHKCSDQKPSRAAIQANRFLSEFGLEKNSFRVFTRAAELHSLALKSDSNENQMLNLWIALESIIPASHDSNISNIEHIVQSTMPFLNLGYYQRLVARLTSDLFNWNRNQTKKVLKDIEGDNQVIKVAKLLSLEDYSDKRQELKDSFKDFHLLYDRFEYLEFIYADPQNMLKGLKNHTIRVGWQIRRIYRARNMIVHSGMTPSYIELLIENVHDYLDHIIVKIITLVNDSQKVLSIEQAFKLTDMTYKALEDTLAEKKLKLKSELIEQMYVS